MVGAKGCPDIARIIHRAKYGKGQLRIELTMLINQMIAQHTFAHLGHLCLDTDQLLHVDLALMPRAGRVRT